MASKYKNTDWNNALNFSSATSMLLMLVSIPYDSAQTPPLILHTVLILIQ